MKTTIRRICREYENGMYKDKYKVVYNTGRVVWYDLKKLGQMPRAHFDFIMNAECHCKYANKYNGTHEGQHLADIFE